MASNTKLPLVQPTLNDLLPSPELRAAFEEKTAAFEAGRFVRDIRHAAHLTQVELAKRLGITQARVSAIETGEGIDGPTFGLVKRIVIACGFSWEPHRWITLEEEKADRSRAVVAEG